MVVYQIIPMTKDGTILLLRKQKEDKESSGVSIIATIVAALALMRDETA